MLRLDDTFFVLIDVQDKLSNVMYEREALIFQLMRTAEHPAFRDILKIVK